MPFNLYSPELFHVLHTCVEMNVSFGFTGSSVLKQLFTLFQAHPKAFRATSRKHGKLLELDQSGSGLKCCCSQRNSCSCVFLWTQWEMLVWTHLDCADDPSGFFSTNYIPSPSLFAPLTPLWVNYYRFSDTVGSHWENVSCLCSTFLTETIRKKHVCFDGLNKNLQNSSWSLRWRRSKLSVWGSHGGRVDCVHAPPNRCNRCLDEIKRWIKPCKTVWGSERALWNQAPRSECLNNGEAPKMSVYAEFSRLRVSLSLRLSKYVAFNKS